MQDVTETLTLDPEVATQCHRMIAAVVADAGLNDEALIRIIAQATKRLYLSEANTVHIVFEHPDIDTVRLHCRGRRVLQTVGPGS